MATKKATKKVTKKATKQAKAPAKKAAKKAAKKSSKKSATARKPLGMKQLRKLEKIITTFADVQTISCSETVHQSDRVIENAYDLIVELLDVAGYYNDPADDTDGVDDVGGVDSATD